MLISASVIDFIGKGSSYHKREVSSAAFKELHASLNKSLFIHMIKLAQESLVFSLNSLDDEEP